MRSSLMCAVLILSSCATNTVDTTGVVGEVARTIIERTTTYVVNDGALTDAQRNTYFLEVSQANEMLDSGSAPHADLYAVMSGIMDRHDLYVEADHDLTGLEKEVYLNSTERLRSLLTWKTGG